MVQLQHFVDRGTLRENVAIGSDGQNWRSAATIPGLSFPTATSVTPNSSQNGSPKRHKSVDPSGGKNGSPSEVESLRASLSETQQELQKLRADRDEAVSLAEQSKGEIQDLEELIGELKGELKLAAERADAKSSGSDTNAPIADSKDSPGGDEPQRESESILAEALAIQNDAEQKLRDAEETKEKNAHLEQQLEQLQSQLDSSQKELDQQQASLAEAEAAIGGRESEISERDRLLAEKESELQEKLERVEQSQTQLDQQRESFRVELELFEQTKTQQADDSDTIPRGQDEEIQMRLSELETRDQSLNLRQQELDQLQQSIESKQTSLQSLENELEVIQRDVKNRTELLESRERDLETKLKTVRESEAQFGSSEQLQNTLQQRDAELARRESNLLQQISSLRERQEAVANEKQNLLISMARREEELARRERELLEREATFVKRGLQAGAEIHPSSSGLAMPLSQQLSGPSRPSESRYFEGVPGQPAQPITDSGPVQYPPNQTQSQQTAQVPPASGNGQPGQVPLNTGQFNPGQVSPGQPTMPVSAGSNPPGSFPAGGVSNQVPVNHSMNNRRAGQNAASSTRGAETAARNGKVVRTAADEKKAFAHRSAQFVQRFGPCSKIEAATEKHKLKIDVCIHPPHEERDFTTLVTSGMSNYPIPMPHGKRSVVAELLLYVAHVDQSSIELLRAAAMIPYLKKNGLSFGSTGKLDLAASGISGSALECCVFMLPVIDSDSKPLSAHTPNEPTTQPFWLVPITSAERKLIDFSGIHKFLPLLEKNSHPLFFDATRDCYVRRKSWFRR